MRINKIVIGSKVIADNVKVCETIASRIKGLMFSKKINNDQALVIVNEKESIKNARLHMMFVFYKIDVVWLNKKLEIVDLKEGAVPFTPLIIPKEAAKYVIEMNNGKIKENKLKTGDRIKFL